MTVRADVALLPAGGRLSFSEAYLVIHQLQLAKARGTVPATRDYLYPARNA